MKFGSDSRVQGRGESLMDPERIQGPGPWVPSDPEKFFTPYFSVDLNLQFVLTFYPFAFSN